MTPQDDEILAADLNKMLVEARGTLPRLAGVYEQCAEALGAARADGRASLDLPEGVSGGRTAPRWEELRRLLHEAVAGTAEGIGTAATYLEDTVHAYTAQDETARAQLEAIMTDGEPPGRTPHGPGDPKGDR